ncbi:MULTISPECIES: glucose uptake protein [unclassified Enterococcus]|uniref:glucose uptake protein n=1 Tax=unclassified Enterococcus TaxID=2608891 RepID=UPI0013EC4E02|nr:MULTISPECIES: glucose uptake protein [unclassified Enterococcus]
MITIGQLVFYIPFFIMLGILFYYIRWTKKKFSVLIASLPAAYFTYQIFSFRHWETTPVLVAHILELTAAVIFLIIWIYILYKKQD